MQKSFIFFSLPKILYLKYRRIGSTTLGTETALSSFMPNFKHKKVTYLLGEKKQIRKNRISFHSNQPHEINITPKRDRDFPVSRVPMPQEKN